MDGSTIESETTSPITPSHWPAIESAALPVVDPRRYDVIGEFARGGLGRILEVYDRRLGRLVALKELLAGRRDDERFLREALVTARLQHPAIVPVHDIGRWPTGEPFYAMKKVAGCSLRQVLAEAHTLDDRLALLPHVIAVAEAMAYAHSHRVIHRDLKPDNVLIGSFGETVVIDWGLAKDLRVEEEVVDDAAPEPLTDGHLTHVGAVLGTPAYMSPEQACGQLVDERTDVYALGALLYEVLAGAPPYQGSSVDEVLQKVRTASVPPVERCQPEVPPDLAAIVRKAMAAQPEKRYPTAAGLVEDLWRFQTGRLVSAHHYSPATLLRRWLKRYRLPVAVATLALLVLAAIAAWSVQRIVAARIEAEAARHAAERRANQLLLSQARGVLERDPTEVLAWLRSYPDTGEDWDTLRALAIEAWSQGVAHDVLPHNGFFAFAADVRGQRQQWIGARDGQTLEMHDVDTGALTERIVHQGQVYRVAVSAAGHILAVRNLNGDGVTIHDRVHATRRVLRHPEAPVTEFALSPDGRWLASADAAGTLLLWPIEGGAARVLSRSGRPVLSIDFSGDARWLLPIFEAPAPLRLWEVASSREVQLSEPSGVSAAVVSPDGTLVACGREDGTVVLWTSVGGLRRVLGTHSGRVTDVAFSPGGRVVASIGKDGLVQVWSVLSGERRLVGYHRGPLATLQFSPDGHQLAAAGPDGEVRLWQWERGETRVLGRSMMRVLELMFSPDGRYLAAMGEDRTARLYSIEGAMHREVQGHGMPIFQTTVSPDGRFLATAGQDRMLGLWSLPGGEGGLLPGHEEVVFRAAFAPSGAFLVSASLDGTLRQWNLRTCPVGAGTVQCRPSSRVLAGHDGPVWAVAVSPDSRWLASAGTDGTVRLWDAAGDAVHVLPGPHVRVRALAFAPDGRTLAVAGDDQTLWLVNVATGGVRSLEGHHDTVYDATYSHDGRHLVTAGWDRTLRLWDLTTGSAQVFSGHQDRLRSVAFTPDDRWLISVGEDGLVLRWEVSTGAMQPLGRHHDKIYQIAIAPDGTLAASASRDRTVQLWDLRRGVSLGALRHAADVSSSSFSPDGRWLISGSTDGVIHFWSLPLLSSVPREPAALQAWMAKLSTATSQGPQLVSP